MTSFAGIRTEQDLARYLTDYVEEAALTDESADTVVDRYHAPDLVWRADGIQLDRQKMIDHIRPVRKRAVGVRVVVHDAMVSGTRFAARYTMYSSTKNGKFLVMDLYAFGRLAGDGRIRLVDQTARTVQED